MFIRVTNLKAVSHDVENVVYLNSNIIKTFYQAKNYTVLILQYGSMLVKETAEEIYTMLKGA